MLWPRGGQQPAQPRGEGSVSVLEQVDLDHKTVKEDYKAETCDGNKVSGDAEPLEGSPATTALDKLPLPEKGQVYINAKKRDEIKDGGTLTLPINEVGPDWNYLNVAGNTLYMHNLWNYYMPALCVLGDATGSKIEPNPDFIKSIKVDESTGKQIITVEYAEKAKYLTRHNFEVYTTKHMVVFSVKTELENQP